MWFDARAKLAEIAGHPPATTATTATQAPPAPPVSQMSQMSQVSQRPGPAHRMTRICGGTVHPSRETRAHGPGA